MMIFQEFKNQIAKNNLPTNKFILYSKDEYSIRTSINMLKSLIMMPELNVTEVNMDTIKDKKDIPNIIAQSETVPFMSNKRIILIRADFLEEDHTDKLDIVKTFEKYLKNMTDSTILVMFFYCKDKRENISKNKKVKKLEKSGAILVTNPKNQTAEIKQIIDNFCKINNKKLDRKVENFIISNASNLDMLVNDMDKLKCLQNIDIDLVKKLFNNLEEDDIFDLTNAVAKQDGVKAIEIINNLLAKGIQPMQIVYNIISQYKRLLYCKISLINGLSIEETAEKLKMHPYACKISCSQSKNFELQKIARTLWNCIDLEIKIKSISMDSKSELELLLVNSLM